MSDGIIYVIILNAEDGFKYKKNMLPTHLGKDRTIFHYDISTDVDTKVIRYIEDVVATPYAKKKTSKTIFETGVILDQPITATIISNIDKLVFWSTEFETNIVSVIENLCDELTAFAAEDTVGFEDFLELKEIKRTGGTYELCEVDSDGEMKEQTTVTINKGGKRAKLSDKKDNVAVIPTFDSATDKDWESVDKLEIISLIAKVTPALKYDGYDPAVTRQVFIEKNNDDVIITKYLLLAFSAYAYAGNNIGKLSIRRVDKKTGIRLQGFCNKIGIARVSREKRGLTLVRLAIAFMPEYLVYRKAFAIDLQSQTDSIIDVVYKDLVFHGCPEVRKMVGYEAYNLEFSSFIANKGKGVKTDDEAFVKSHKQWNSVSSAGYTNDSIIHDRMKLSINSKFATSKDGFNYIQESIRLLRSPSVVLDTTA